MTTEYLIPENHNGSAHFDDPYTAKGARRIMARFRDDVIDMLDHMMKERRRYEEGKTFLAKSPLRSKPWVAAAMKTLGLVEEVPSPNGACALVLTERALEQINRMLEVGDG